MLFLLLAQTIVALIAVFFMNRALNRLEHWKDIAAKRAEQIIRWQEEATEAKAMIVGLTAVVKKATGLTIKRVDPKTGLEIEMVSGASRASVEMEPFEGAWDEGDESAVPGTLPFDPSVPPS